MATGGPVEREALLEVGSSVRCQNGLQAPGRRGVVRRPGRSRTVEPREQAAHCVRVREFLEFPRGRLRRWGFPSPSPPVPLLRCLRSATKPRGRPQLRADHRCHRVGRAAVPVGSVSRSSSRSAARAPEAFPRLPATSTRWSRPCSRSMSACSDEIELTLLIFLAADVQDHGHVVRQAESRSHASSPNGIVRYRGSPHRAPVRRRARRKGAGGGPGRSPP